MIYEFIIITVAQSPSVLKANYLHVQVPVTASLNVTVTSKLI